MSNKLFISIILVLYGSVYAKATSNDYQSFVDKAILSNSQILADQANIDASMEDIAITNSWPDPQITYNHFVDPIETKSGPQKAQISAMLTVPWIPKYSLNSKVQEHKNQALKYKQEDLHAKVAHEVRLNYFSLVEYKSELETLKVQEKLLEQLSRIKARQVTVSKAQNVDVLKLADQIAKLKEMQNNIKIKLSSHITKLKLLINDEKVDFTKVQPKFPILLLNLQKIMNARKSSMLISSPNIQQASAMVRAQLSSKKREQHKYVPDLKLGVTKFIIDEQNNSSGKDGLAISATVSIPLWYKKYSGSVSASDSRIREAKHKFENNVLELKQVIQHISEKISLTQESSELYKTILIPQAQQIFSINQRRYQESQITSDQMITDINNLLNYQIKGIEYQGRVLKLYSELAQKLGVTKLEDL